MTVLIQPYIGGLIVPVTSFGQNYLRVEADLSSATWNTVAGQSMIAVTGFCRVVTFYECTESLTSSGAATLAFGYTGTVDAYSAAQAYTNIVASRLIAPGGTVYTNGTTHTNFLNATQVADIVTGTRKLGFTIATAAATAGKIVAHCFWTPIGDGASVAAGDGGAL